MFASKSLRNPINCPESRLWIYSIIDNFYIMRATKCNRFYSANSVYRIRHSFIYYIFLVCVNEETCQSVYTFLFFCLGHWFSFQLKIRICNYSRIFNGLVVDHQLLNQNAVFVDKNVLVSIEKFWTFFLLLAFVSVVAPLSREKNHWLHDTYFPHKQMWVHTLMHTAIQLKIF